MKLKYDYESIVGMHKNNLDILSFDRVNGNLMYYCRCDCGNKKWLHANFVYLGKTVSCGCYRKTRSIKHHKYRARIYNCWLNMKARCNRKSAREYENYGGRGITYCKEWEDFTSFMKWAYENGYDDTLTLDRIDVNANYSPNNCRWITNQEQQNNKRNNHFVTFNGATMTIAQWSRKLGFCQKTLEKRIKKWGVERALTEPLHLDHKRNGKVYV